MQYNRTNIALLCSTFSTDIAPMCSTNITGSALLCSTFSTDIAPMCSANRTDSAPLCGTFWGQILGRNPDKSLKSFPSCYTQSPLQLCLEFSISSNSRNLLQFLEFSHLYTVKEKGGKSDIKPWPPPYGSINTFRNLEISQIMLRNLNKIVRSWIRHRYWYWSYVQYIKNR